MKTCPVCGAGAFDDAEVCFGCLHRYEEHETTREEHPMIPQVVDIETPPPNKEAQPVAAPVVPEAPREEAGWAVRFEFPGFTPTPGWEQMAGTAQPLGAFATTEGGCGLLKGADTSRQEALCNMVVRLQPIALAKQEERRRGRSTRGSHERVVAQENVPCAALPGLS